MKKITPLIKGAITGALMVILVLALYYTKQPADSPYQYLLYVLYGGGIAWALFDYSRSDSYTGKFGDIFGQGFRCFVIVTLVYVAFTGIFTKMHPEFAQEASEYYRKDLVAQKNKTPNEIDTAVSDYKSQFTTNIVSTTIFGNLILGAIFTVAGAAVLLMRRK